MEYKKELLSELEEKYKGLCAILLFLSLTKDIGDERKHDIAIKRAEDGIRLICKKMEALKRGDLHEYEILQKERRDLGTHRV